MRTVSEKTRETQWVNFFENVARGEEGIVVQLQM